MWLVKYPHDVTSDWKVDRDLDRNHCLVVEVKDSKKNEIIGKIIFSFDDILGNILKEGDYWYDIFSDNDDYVDYMNLKKENITGEICLRMTNFMYNVVEINDEQF